MDLDEAIKKVKKAVSKSQELKFDEKEELDLLGLLKELKAKRDEELKALGYRLRRDKKFIFTYHWAKVGIGNHSDETGTKQAVFIGHTILDAVNQYVDDVIHRGYDIAFIDYAVEE